MGHGRQELKTLLEFIEAGDVLIVTRIDRLARSIGDLQDIVRALKAKGVALRTTEQPIDTSNAAGRIFLRTRLIRLPSTGRNHCCGSIGQRALDDSDNRDAARKYKEVAFLVPVRPAIRSHGVALAGHELEQREVPLRPCGVEPRRILNVRCRYINGAIRTLRESVRPAQARIRQHLAYAAVDRVDDLDRIVRNRAQIDFVIFTSPESVDWLGCSDFFRASLAGRGRTLDS
jgi:Resolvase, N terminal domain